MLKFMVLVLGFASSGAMASQVLHCFNPATGSEFIVSSDTNGAHFQMNSNLNQALLRQCSSTIPVPYNGVGTTYTNSGVMYYSAGEPKGWSLNIHGSIEGMMLNYINYVDFIQGRPTATFYFNPSECALSP
jgi:hypothetical protein